MVKKKEIVVCGILKLHMVNMPTTSDDGYNSEWFILYFRKVENWCQLTMLSHLEETVQMNRAFTKRKKNITLSPYF